MALARGLQSRRVLVAGLAGAVMLGLSVPLAAQPPQPARAAGFPSRTLRIIVPFTPGGANDVVAREIAAGLQA
jgi:tripartite-type tricarboxylate transporter receptor subunit TctC